VSHACCFAGLTVSQVVCLIHKDTLPDEHVALPQLCHLATTTVRVGPATQSSRGNPVACITHKKQGGRVLKKVSEVTLKYSCHSYISVKIRLNTGSVHYLSVWNPSSSYDLPKYVQIKICKTITLPVVLYGMKRHLLL
jgi:hypothetical protein